MRSGTRTISLVAALASLTLLSVTRAAEAQKTDILTFHNGDQVTGEIKEMTLGSLRFSTTPMGTVEVKQREISRLMSDKTFEFELTTGETIVGVMGLSEDETLEIVAQERSYNVDWLAVTKITPIKDKFWKQLDGAIDVGVGYLQASKQWDTSLGVEVRHTVAKARWLLTLNSTLRTTDSVVTAQRQSLMLGYNRKFAPKWFWSVVGFANSNRELNLDFRATGTGGVGRIWVTTSRVEFRSVVGLAASREKFKGQDSNDLYDAMIGSDVRFFIRSGFKTDPSADLAVLPSLSQSGRWRLYANLSGRREFFKDFFFKLKLFETFDSNPPTETQRRNDFGIETSLGWSF
jgi:hypothetical protein